MKSTKRFTAVLLAVLSVCVLAGALSVSAADPTKIEISHFNRDDVYSNASVIFTKSFLGDKTLGEVTAEYKGRMGDQIAAVDREWNDTYTDHKFSQYFVLSCDWDGAAGAYVVQSADTGGNVGSFTCPLNGFILAVHCDRDRPGETPHNYPSTTGFGEKNLGKAGTSHYVSSGTWKSFAGQSVYLYNVNLEAADAAEAIQTTGTFDSKISEAGIQNGLVEVYDGFSTESYISIGAEDAAATSAPFFPSNVSVDFSAITALINKVNGMDEYDYTESSWQALQDAIHAHEVNDPDMDTAGMLAWRSEINDAIAALVPTGGEAEPGDEGEGPTGEGEQGGITHRGDKKTGDDNTLLIIIIAVVAVLVIAGVVFLLVALKKKKAASASPAAPVADAKAEDAPSAPAAPAEEAQDAPETKDEESKDE